MPAPPHRHMTVDRTSRYAQLRFISIMRPMSRLYRLQSAERMLVQNAFCVGSSFMVMLLDVPNCLRSPVPATIRAIGSPPWNWSQLGPPRELYPGWVQSGPGVFVPIRTATDSRMPDRVKRRHLLTLAKRPDPWVGAPSGLGARTSRSLADVNAVGNPGFLRP